jgi:ABC-2 type transport system permease protein
MTTAPLAPPARPASTEASTLGLRAFRVLSVARLDLVSTLRRPMWWTWIALIGFLALAFSRHSIILPGGDSAVGGKSVWLTSEFAVASDAMILGLMLHVFFITIVAGMSVIRDEEYQIGEILHATPLTAGEYIWGKFFAVLVSFLLVIAAEFTLFAISNHLYPHNSSPELYGPFAFGNYFRPALVFAVPQFLFLGGVAFMVGERSRRPILIFVLPAAVLLLTVMVLGHDSAAQNSGRGLQNLLMWCDPTGLAWFRDRWIEADRGADFYNHGRIVLDPAFLLSRFALAGLGLGAVAFSQIRFGRTLRRAARGGVARDMRPSAPPVQRWPGAVAQKAPPPLAALKMQSWKPKWFTAVLSVADIEWRELRTQPGLYLFVPLIVLFTTTATVGETGMLGTPLLLTAGMLAEHQFGALTVFLSLILIVYTVESLEREKACRFWTIRNTMPISTSAMLFGKFLTLNCVALAVAFACASIDFLVLASNQGRVPITLGPFFLLWGVLGFPTVWAIIAGTMAAYCVTGSRAGAYVLGLLAMIFYTAIGSELTWAGNLALVDAVHWSDLSVLEMDRYALILNRLTTVAVAFFYGALAVRYFPRRERDPVRFASALRPGPMFRTALVLTLFGLPGLVGTFFLAQGVERGQGGATIEDAQKDYWTKNVNQWRDAPLPGLRDADLAVDLYPSDRAFKVHGTYLLFNKDSKPLAHIPITCGFQWKDLRWTLDGKPYKSVKRAGLYVITPPSPILPGKTVALGFSYSAPNPGISKNGVGMMEFVLPSAVVLTSFSTRFVPQIGYDPSIGVDEDNESEPPDVSISGIIEPKTPLFGAPTPFTLRMQVSAPWNFGVNCVGDKIDDQVEGNRRTTVWRSAHPVSAFNIVGGFWKEKRAPGAAVFYHPDHGVNVSEMLSALTEARRNYSEWYAPYPDKELKLSEFPALAGYAQGFATNITFGEEMGFLTEAEEQANAPFAVTAHEAAHQWWGNMVVPGDAPGGNVISEGMAQFSAAMLLDTVKGSTARRAFLKETESEYFKSRSVDSELPLGWTSGAKAGDQAVTYEKGGWAFFMLAHQMGWANAQTGFRKFIATYRHSAKPPKLSDLTDTLREFAPDKTGFDAAVQQWFYQTGIPEYRLSNVHREKAAGNHWKVTAQVKNVGAGRAVVEIGAWPEKHGNDPRTWTLGTLTLGAGETETLTFDCPAKPARVTVDPLVTTLQSNRGNATYQF